VAFGQIESAWPVCGSVLVDGGVVYAAAGRGPKVDGGHALLALEAATGKPLWEKRLPQTDSTGQFILLTDGQEGYMGGVKFPLKAPAGPGAVKRPVLETGYGLLSNPWRRLPTSVHRGQNHLAYGGVSGLQVVFDERAAYAYNEIKNTRAKGKVGNWGFILPSHVFAATPRQPGQAASGGERAGPPPLWTWPVPEPAQVEAMVISGQTLLAAGPADKFAAKTGKLWTISTADGAKRAELDLEAAPVYDGLAAAGGRLYLATRDGMLLCLGDK
jgi:hypothetical protein